MCMQADSGYIVMCVRRSKLCRSPPRGGIHYSDLQAARLINEGDIPAVAIEIDTGEKRERAARYWAAILV